MNVIVVGLGSMGKRRIRLIKELYPYYNIYGVDRRVDRREEATEVLGIECFDEIDAVAEQYKIDMAFICTSPLSHNKIIKTCLEHKWHVFSEINLVTDGYTENISLAKKNECILFLSSTFFYRAEIQFLLNKIDGDKKWDYIYHVGQYLPDWHPWENYKEFFVGDKRTNGCREIMAIELPWITKLFGNVVDYNVISDKITSLNIDYNDNYMIQFVHENGSKGIFVVDVVSPVAVRRLEVYSEKRYYRWNGTYDSLYEYNEQSDSIQNIDLQEAEEHREGYRAFVVENAYRNEIKEFIEVINGEREQSYGFEEDLKILNLIDSLEGID